MRARDLKQHPKLDTLEVVMYVNKFGQHVVEVSDGVTVERAVDVTPWNLEKTIKQLKRLFPLRGNTYDR